MQSVGCQAIASVFRQYWVPHNTLLQGSEQLPGPALPLTPLQMTKEIGSPGYFAQGHVLCISIDRELSLEVKLSLSILIL